MLCSPALVFAQAEPDDIALAEDAFQDNFYESLKQKALKIMTKQLSL